MATAIIATDSSWPMPIGISALSTAVRRFSCSP